MDDSGNNFSLYVGVVVEDKPLGSRQALIYIRELTPFVAGSIGDKTKDEGYMITDREGNQISGTIKTSNSVVADYAGLFTNRQFPPDVVKGEQVLVFKYRDEDKYYWLSFGRDDNIRKLEWLRLEVSDSVDQQKQLNESNTYFIELDTAVAKRIRMKTSKASGEIYEYEFIIDAKNGFASLSDDQGNTFTLESGPHRIWMQNADKTTVVCDKEHIRMVANASISIRAGKRLIINSPYIGITATDFVVQSATLATTAGSTTTTAAGGNVNYTASNITITADVQINGNLRVSGNITAGSYSTG